MHDETMTASPGKFNFKFKRLWFSIVFKTMMFDTVSHIREILVSFLVYTEEET